MKIFRILPSILFLNILMFTECSDDVTGQNLTGNNNFHTEYSESILYVRRVLILGDSHLLGNFGEMLQKELHESGKFDILSIAIGGAGSRNFTMTMRNNCCGYAIRQTLHNENLASGQKIRRIEGNNNPVGEIVGKKYNGSLENVLRHFGPHIVIIALGHNNINDHQNLVNMMYSFNQNIQIVWVSPANNRSIQRQLRDIRKVVNDNHLFLVRSDDILGNDTARCIHFSGKTAHRWAVKVTERMIPVISVQYNYNQEIFEYLNICKLDTFPLNHNYFNEIFYSTFQGNMTGYSVAAGLIHNGGQTFRPGYLSRIFSQHFARQLIPQTISDIDGNTYQTIIIGNSVWMSENLRTTRYADGTIMNNAAQIQNYYVENEPAYLFVYRNQKKEQITLYTWHAVSSSVGICPAGWHVPDISDWVYLMNNIQNIEDFFNTSTSLKSTDGKYFSEFSEQYFWTMNALKDQSQSAWVAGYDQSSEKFRLLNRYTKNAFPVRCVKD